MQSFNELIEKIPSSIYSRQPESDIAKLYKLYSEEFDELKKVTEDIGKLRLISDQKGAILDEIGKIVREPRRNLTDDEYRGYLYIAILRNISSGSLDTISQLVKLVSQNTDYSIRDMQKIKETFFDSTQSLNGTRLLNPGHGQPAKFDVTVSLDENQKEYLKNLLNEIKSAGTTFEVK